MRLRARRWCATTRAVSTMMFAVRVATASADVTPSPTVTCTGAPDKARAIPRPSKGRLTLCAIDVGSNTAKLQVVSMDPKKPLSFKDERQCRARLGLGAIVFDAATGERKPLPSGETARLVEVVTEFHSICALDKGEMLGAEATQWARDATNIEEVRRAVKAGAGIDLEVLTPEWEGHFGYVAATRNVPGRFALDPGSNSFQISWWPQGAEVARTVSVPMGFVRAAEAYYGAQSDTSFEAARERHAQEIRRRLDEALGALNPSSSLAQLKTAVGKGALSPEIFVLGQDGALHLALRGRLRAGDGGWIASSDAYERVVASDPTVRHKRYGEIHAELPTGEVARFVAELGRPADFDALRREPVRALYGAKTLANAVLLDTMARELGVKRVVMVPQEMPAGFILFKLALGH